MIALDFRIYSAEPFGFFAQRYNTKKGGLNHTI